MNRANEAGNPPLYELVGRGNPNFCDTLPTMKRCNVDAVNAQGESLLIRCARLGHSKVMDALLKYVSDAQRVESQRARNGLNAWLSYFDENVEAEGDETNHCECIQMLSEFGVDVHQTVRRQRALFDLAARRCTLQRIAASTRR